MHTFDSIHAVDIFVENYNFFLTLIDNFLAEINVIIKKNVRTIHMQRDDFSII